jgi:sugar/nucleoside kinase (ribokinase family)
MTAHTVLIVGSMAFDDLELPSATATDVVGGSATYGALAAALFAPVRVVAVVGDDFPEPVVEDLARRGVDVSGIERSAGKTFRWAGRYAKNLSSRTTLRTELNVFADFRPKLPASFADSSFLLLGNIHPDLQLEVLEQVRAPRFVAADTMNFWIDGERPALERVLARIDTLVINDEELRQLAGEHNIRRAARAALALGPKRLVVKRGEYGALLFDEHGSFFAPAYPLEDEIDPTGAGDSFAGALIGQIARTGAVDRASLRRALLVSSTVASYCVEDVGTRRLAALRLEDVDARLDELRRFVRVD